MHKVKWNVEDQFRGSLEEGGEEYLIYCSTNIAIEEQFDVPQLIRFILEGKQELIKIDPLACDQQRLIFGILRGYNLPPPWKINRRIRIVDHDFELLLLSIPEFQISSYCYNNRPPFLVLRLIWFGLFACQVPHIQHSKGYKGTYCSIFLGV